MQEMKFDMSGGAAVLEAAGDRAAGLPVTLTAVVPSPRTCRAAARSSRDIVTAMNGKTIEVNNTTPRAA